MRGFWGVARYEFHMQVRRRALWIPFVVVAILFGPVPYLLSGSVAEAGMLAQEPAQAAPEWALNLNRILPVVVGLLLADRLARDGFLGVDELLPSLPLSRRGYVAGKVAGATAATILPIVVLYVWGGLYLVYQSPFLATVGRLVAAFGAINLPGLFFVAAFSVACPVVIPVRAYQVLFVGYWIWGTMLNPQVFPTLNETWLTPTGIHAYRYLAGAASGAAGTSLIDLVGSIGLLLVMGLGILAVLERYLAVRADRA